MTWKRFFITTLMPVVLAGCTLAPDYRRPEAPVPARWPAGPAYGETTAEAAPLPPWQAAFPDARLRQVIEKALAQNRDLRLALLNVERARALYGVQRAELFPSVNATGGMSRSRVPGDLSSSGQATTNERYDVSLGVAAWEIDLFGRIRSLKERALEEYLATEQAARGAQILLVATTAQAYLTLAADRETLRTAAATLEAQEASRRLIRRQVELGIASELDLKRADGQVEAARVEVARWTQTTAQDENGLRWLTGADLPPELLPAGLEGLAEPAAPSPGLSSERLLRRPDILAAEHRLRAANANIGAARAAFFPRIALTAAVGTASAELSGLFRGGQGTWSFAPQVLLPIFDARTWSAYDVTQADREITVAQYEKAIQTAFREVADALAVRGTVERQIEAQDALVAAAAEAHRLSRVRYDRGLDGYLAVLDAQRTLYAAQQGLTALRLARLANRVTLYRVLGGGV